MAEPARIAVVGTGWWATDNHIPGLLANPAAVLVAICDADEAKLDTAATAFGVERCYTNVDEMLRTEQLDAVIVATNHASHYAVAKPCLDAGLHVLIEKPMTLYAAEARDLLAIAARRGRQISIGYNHNYTAWTRCARERILAGDLGAVQYITGVFNQHIWSMYQGKTTGVGKVNSPGDVYSDPLRSGGGHGHLQMTHLLGMIFFATGLRARTVQAKMHNLGLAVDVVNALLIEFDNGALAALGGTGNIPNGHKIDLQIYCADGWVDIDESKGIAAIGGSAIQREDFAPEDGVHGYRRHATTNNLVDIVLGRAVNGSPGEIGLRVVEVLDAAYRSAANCGNAVQIEDLYR
ncbi:MAG: Gfo/Idh/MocA family oxidoreductase [Caldilineaceae bacterium]